MPDNYYVRDMKRAATDYIYSFYPVYKQINAALGITNDSATIADFISRVKARCDEYEAAHEQGQFPAIDYTDIAP